MRKIVRIGKRRKRKRKRRVPCRGMNIGLGWWLGYGPFDPWRSWESREVATRTFALCECCGGNMLVPIIHLKGKESLVSSRSLGTVQDKVRR